MLVSTSRVPCHIEVLLQSIFHKFLFLSALAGGSTGTQLVDFQFNSIVQCIPTTLPSFNNFWNVVTCATVFCFFLCCYLPFAISSFNGICFVIFDTFRLGLDVCTFYWSLGNGRMLTECQLGISTQPLKIVVYSRKSTEWIQKVLLIVFVAVFR